MKNELFPRANIENLSVSRLIIGTNWFLGFSHTSKAKDNLIKTYMDREKIAEVLIAFMEEGIDTLLGVRDNIVLLDAIKEAEDKTGKKMITITTPSLDVSGTPAGEDKNKRIFDEAVKIGAKVCMPHQSTTDVLCDRRARVIRDMEKYCSMMRERGLIPGLSTHLPEVIKYADETNLDIACYIQIYNAIGFLMPLEVDWVNRIIWEARHPVIVIKPLASGRLLPLAGLAFVWSTIRPCDMVVIGCMSPDEAKEVIEVSRAIFEHRCPHIELQKTRSKIMIENM